MSPVASLITGDGASAISVPRAPAPAVIAVSSSVRSMLLFIFHRAGLTDRLLDEGGRAARLCPRSGAVACDPDVSRCEGASSHPGDTLLWAYAGPTLDVGCCEARRYFRSRGMWARMSAPLGPGRLPPGCRLLQASALSSPFFLGLHCFLSRLPPRPCPAQNPSDSCLGCK